MYNLSPKSRFVSSVGNGLFNSASLDLRFATTKSLVDAATGAQLVTFTRASSGTFVGSDGVLQTAVTNLLLRSEEFDDASWTKINCSISPNAIAAPNGTLTADKVVENTAASAAHIAANETISVTSGISYRLSVYCKAAERNWVFMLGSGSPFGTDGIYVNLSNGATGSSLGSPGSVVVTPFGDGWYRISFSITAGSSAAAGLQVRTATGNNGGGYTGDGTSGIYVWGAQLEQSSTVGDYIPTTSTINSAPRFDHNPTTGESLGLLVEEARTNLLLRSEEFNNAQWAKTRSTVTANATTSPTGAVTADKLVEDTTATNNHQLVVIPALGSAVYTVSVFAKAAERTQLALRLDIPSTETVIFNLSTGVVVSTSAGVTSSITPFANGWYRVTATLVSAAALSNVVFQLAVGGSVFYTGDGTSGIYIWGAQLETGAFPTSYIPTTSATVTRAADVASITGSNFSSWYNQTEGTVYHQGRTPATANFFSIDDGTSNNRITSYMPSATAPYLFVQAGGASIANLTSSAITAGSTFAQSNAYKTADFAMSTNGGTVSTASSGAVPVVNKMVIGANVSGAAAVNGTIKRLTFWPTRLSNTVLQQITQP